MPAKTTETKPTYEQAQLHLQLYEQRREARLREARDWFVKNYFANSMEESMRVAAPGTDNGAKVMMVFSYWEQACALLNYGLLHEDLFFETSGEFFGVWERIRPIIPEAEDVFESGLSGTPGKGRYTLRAMDRSPLAGPDRNHAEVYGADEAEDARGISRRSWNAGASPRDAPANRSQMRLLLSNVHRPRGYDPFSTEQAGRASCGHRVTCDEHHVYCRRGRIPRIIARNSA